MSVRIFKAPPGLDYDPVRGAHSDISFGIVRAIGAGGAAANLQTVIAKRLFPWGAPLGGQIDWRRASAEPWEILLPPGAPCSLWEVSALCDAYHAHDCGLIQDLAAVVTLRWPEVESLSVSLPAHEAWECSRSFAIKLTRQYSVAAVAAFHVPARAWSRGAPHAHLILPCRAIRPGTGFASFCKPLTNPAEGRQAIDDLWSTHVANFTFSRPLNR